MNNLGKAIVILPSYNEKQNIKRMIAAIFRQQKFIKNYVLQVLVVDDRSPDGTGEIVKKLQKRNNKLFLLEGKKNGLGAAYKRGFIYALDVLFADVVFEMDADFSHNPNKIPIFLKTIDKGYDFVIGSRYIKYGTIPNNWSILRKANSKWGNVFARQIANLNDIHDCTGGYRAITKGLLKKIDVQNLSVMGYAFQISLLNSAKLNNAKFCEIPINFIDRTEGKSKIRIEDIREFLVYVISLRLKIIKESLLIKLKIQKELEALHV